LDDESQTIGIIESKSETEIPIAEILPQDSADSEHKSAADLIQQDEEEKNYGGIHRTGYFFGMLGVAVINGIFNAAGQGESGIASIAWIITLVASFVLVVSRLHNIGMSGWWSLLILVPVANLFVGVKCAMCPEGYQYTKTLDTAGKIIAGIFFGLVVLVLISVVIGVLSS
jgi:uncharacterized membrane protein YhaH (DUF805 family)